MRTLTNLARTSRQVGAYVVTLVCCMLFSGCQDDIDKSAMYTFTGQTIADILDDDPDFSDYYELTQRVMPTSVSQSPVSKLLSARGHYSCFAPTNEAMQTYLTKLYEENVITTPVTKAYDIEDEVVRDSIMKVIVLNSVIDCGSENEPYQTFDFKNATTLPLANMNDRLLRTDITSENGQTVYLVSRTCRVIKRDMEATNGYIQKMDQVVAPTNSNLSDMMLNTANMSVFNSFLAETGFNEKLTDYRDEVYEQGYLNNTIDRTLGTLLDVEKEAICPEHRYIGFTIFAETNDVLSSLGNITDVESLITYLVDNGYYQGYDTRLKEEGGDYTSPDHILYQFVAYHILPMSIPHDRLVNHVNEYGHKTGSSEFGVPVYEYYATMSENPRRMIKLTESKQSEGIRINRYTEMLATANEYEEIVNENTIPGILISADNGDIDNEAINGYVYPIDNILVYDEEVMKEKVLNERIRFDIASCLPELMTNKLRGVKDKLPSPNGECRGFPTNYPYFGDNMTYSETSKVQYLHGWKRGGYLNYQANEFNIMGRYDVTMKLPPIPYDGTFELRYYMSVNPKRGLAQVYFGEEGKIKAMGVPLDLRMGGKTMSGTNGSVKSPAGWEADVEDDEDYNNLIDKRMRNNGYMKGPKYWREASSSDIYASVRNEEWRIRQILFTAQMERNKTYYVRFKSVLESEKSEFFFDCLELVPSNIYNNPEKKEDIW